MVEQHKHCPICATPIPMSERYCSPNCEQIAIENQKKVKKGRRLLYVLFAVFVLAWLFFMLKGKIGL